MTLRRREFLAAGAVLAFGGCERRRPETPLAHLYGQKWVTGAYTHYAQAYAEVEDQSERDSTEAYRVLVQRGVTALEGLQQREVPFYVRVDPGGAAFHIERDVPERLTFTADMTPAQREAATVAWKRARDHIQRDYDEVRRLDWALTRLLSSTGHVRHAIDEGQLEQFRLCRQLDQLEAGGALPFELPYQVSRADYQNVLALLLDRLETDRTRLSQVESSMVATGLVARATDAGSSSLAVNLKKVLLAVAEDAEALGRARSTDYPSEDDRAAALLRAQALRKRITASPEYQRFLQAQREREDVIGQLLVVLDQMTGLPTSAIYRQVLRIWRGEGDYLSYLQMAASMVPGTAGLSSTLRTAVERTEQARKIVSDGVRVAELLREGGAEQMIVAEGGGLLNAATPRAKEQLARQLVFLENADELRAVSEALAGTPYGAP